MVVFGSLQKRARNLFGCPSGQRQTSVARDEAEIVAATLVASQT